MRKLLLLTAIMLSLTSLGKDKTKKTVPVTVIITAGQSNTDGRVPNTQLPEYIQKNKYKYCKWCYGCGGCQRTNGFETFWPGTSHTDKPGRWAYDAVTYYWLEQALQREFYVIKWSIGGTSIDPECRSSKGKHWSADPEWLAANTSTATGGKSLLKSFTEEIDSCIDHKLAFLPQGYDIKAFLWHQGESDYTQGERYYANLKAVVAYVRQHLVAKTGRKKYARLPFICGTVARSNKCYNADVEAAMFRLAKEDKHFYVVDMSDGELQSDRLHFTAPSAEYLGKQMYNILVDIGIAGKGVKKVD